MARVQRVKVNFPGRAGTCPPNMKMSPRKSTTTTLGKNFLGNFQPNRSVWGGPKFSGRVTTSLWGGNSLWEIYEPGFFETPKGGSPPTTRPGAGTPRGTPKKSGQIPKKFPALPAETHIRVVPGGLQLGPGQRTVLTSSDHPWITG